MRKAVFGIARNFNQANTLVTRLQEVGFPLEEISMLAPDTESDRVDPAAGNLLGGALALLANIRPLAILGVGPFIAAGPIMQFDAAAAGLAGGLIGLGIPEMEARLFEEKLKQGNFLVSVQALKNKDVDRARETFKNSGAEDVCLGEKEDTKVG